MSQPQPASPERRKRRLIQGPVVTPRPSLLSPEEVADTVMDRTLTAPSKDDYAVVVETEAYLARERAEATRQSRERLNRLLRAAAATPVVEDGHTLAPRTPSLRVRTRSSRSSLPPISRRARCPTLRPALEVLSDARREHREEMDLAPVQVARALLPGCDARVVGATQDPALFEQFWTAHLGLAQRSGDLALATTATAMLRRAERVGVRNLVGVHVHLAGKHHAIWVDLTTQEVVAQASPAHVFLPIRTE